MDLLISTRKGLFVADLAREQPLRCIGFLGDPVTYGFVDQRTGHWFAALEHGHFGPKLHRSEDQGVTWTEVGTPCFPEKPADSSDELAWTLKTIWSIAAAGEDKPGELWLGSIPGGLFRSKDNGDSWSLCESLWNHPDRLRWFGGGADQPGMHSIVVDPRNTDRVLVAISCGGVWETTDAGANWTVRAEGMRADFMPPDKAGDPVIQDPHLVVACSAAPDTLWTQHHCGIWRSVDGAKSWQEIPEAGPSTFGFAVAVHPQDPDTAWFVPAISDQHRIPVDGKVVVTRTRDGGKSFETLRQGLPQEEAYDLVFRHALDVSADGNSLAFGSTTGSVWTSADQGDSWRLIGSHLPPVYALTWIS